MHIVLQMALDCRPGLGGLYWNRPPPASHLFMILWHGISFRDLILGVEEPWYKLAKSFFCHPWLVESYPIIKYEYDCCWYLKYWNGIILFLVLILYAKNRDTNKTFRPVFDGRLFYWQVVHQCDQLISVSNNFAANHTFKYINCSIWKHVLCIYNTSNSVLPFNLYNKYIYIL